MISRDLVQVLVLSCFMMASHRWAHTQQERLSPLIARLQTSGLLLSHIDHSFHHVDYNCNFAIFTGWCNPALNRATAHLLGERSELWLGVLALWGGFVPFLVARYYNRRRRSEPDGWEERGYDDEDAKELLLDGCLK